MAAAQQAHVAFLVSQAAGRTLRFDETAATSSLGATVAGATRRATPVRGQGATSVAEAVALAGSPTRFAATRSLPVW